MATDFTLEPPDPHGAAGPGGIIQTVNLRIAYWSKSGAAIWGPTALSSFWSSVGVVANNLLSDPRALYDRGSGRFYVTMQEADLTAQKSYLNIAVSKNSDPASNSSADWFFYRIENTEVAGGASYWSDYPGLGIDGQAVYVTFNMYSFPLSSASFTNCQIAVLNKAAFSSGTTNYSFVYTPAGFQNAFTLQPASVIGPTDPGNVAYFGETPLIDSTSLRIWALQDPLGAATLTSAVVAIADTGGFINGAPQPGTGITIDTVNPRAQGNAFWFNGGIWFCNTAGTTKTLAY